jgi:hypothetical protein
VGKCQSGMQQLPLAKPRREPPHVALALAEIEAGHPVALAPGERDCGYGALAPPRGSSWVVKLARQYGARRSNCDYVLLGVVYRTPRETFGCTG